MSLLESLAKAALATVTVPIAVIADIATMGGVLNDREQLYTSEAMSDLVKNLKNATRPE